MYQLYHLFLSTTKTISFCSHALSAKVRNTITLGAIFAREMDNKFVSFLRRSFGRSVEMGFMGRAFPLSAPLSLSLSAILMDPRCGGGGGGGDYDDGEFLPTISNQPTFAYSISFISDPMERAMTRVIRKRVSLQKLPSAMR